jgi:hypothetical protein
VERSRAVRIDGHEAPVQRRRPLGGCLGAKPRPQGRIRRGPRQEPADQGPVVKARAAHQDGPAPTRPHGFDRRSRLPAEAGRVISLVRLHDVHEVMANGTPLGVSGLPCSDIHPAVYLTGVDADDLDRPVLRQGDRQARLPDAGRTENREQRDAAGRRHAGHQVRRSSRLMSPSGIRDTIGRPWGQ